MSKKLKAAVIGSGLGGLAAAIRLQSAGYETTIFEKRDKPGGRAYVFKDNGFTFDAGPTVITAPHCLEELFELSGRKLSDYVELMPVEPFYRLMWEDKFVFDYGSSVEETLDQIQKKSPQDVEGYKKFLNYSREVFEEGYTKLVHVPFLNWWSMIRVSPQLARLSAHKSVYAQVSKFIKDPHLRQAFSFHSLLVGGNPFDTSSIYTLIHFLERKWGVYFPKGGTGALVNGLVKLFEELGGKIQCNSEVEQILNSNQKVIGLYTKKDGFYPFDIVISNADVMHTYEKLLSDSPIADQQRNRLRKMKYSMSLFLIYFGTKKQYPEMAHHTVLFGPRYRELLKDIFKEGRLADDFSLYLHAPTRSDPDLAPPGHEAFYVLAPVPNLSKSEVDWNVEGPKYAQKILNYLDERYLPGLKENLVTQRIFTPLDFESELNAHQGSAFSLEPLLTQSAFFRTRNRDAEISGLYFVGAGTHPGAGVPGVVNSAKATVGLVLEDFAHG
ncbi:phytoene desaturase [Peredibacter starrii]|uniref:Phytoene dehydrogenase n=1 Tax=Peredibacter starrii TaxID=28202 RepID=A0AAX4HPU6_9BACT|nr:phytoene desaturase [Peredibacter starrii]WPU65131.1 phytoene desaturase [Peredibacter starrii]